MVQVLALSQNREGTVFGKFKSNLLHICFYYVYNMIVASLERKLAD